MVSFSCEACGDVLTKGKLDKHKNQCRGASFSCLDCMVHFRGNEYKSHTSCVSEAQKYQGHLYRPDKDKKGKGDRKNPNVSDAAQNYRTKEMRPPGAYVEDVPDEGEPSTAVAIVDVPPRAPTPPAPLPENVNVFDFLVTDATPGETRKTLNGKGEKRMVEQAASQTNGSSRYAYFSQHSQAADGQYSQDGFSYGHGPIQPTFERYESWHNLAESQGSQAMLPPPPYATPAPKHDHKDRKDKSEKSEKSEKKRKRHVEDLDLSSAKRPASRDNNMTDAPPFSTGRVLHSGLTGGLGKLLTRVEDFDPNDRIDAGPTPISPVKRSKRDRDVKDDRRKSAYVSYGTSKSTASASHASERDARNGSRDHHSSHHDDRHRSRKLRAESLSSDDFSNSHYRSSRAIENHTTRPGSVQPTAANQMVRHRSPAELFLSFVTKGPESERGVSINKALKRFHRERDVRGDEKDDEDKELWKNLRLRRNERGEIVLFV